MVIREVFKVQDKIPVKHAFISVFNKSQIEMLVEQLFAICPGIKILSSGGTYTHLEKFFRGKEGHERLIEVSDYTGLPETDGGLVKTLHHKLFLGYLTEQFNEKHHADLKRENAVPIDLVIVNVYPFSEVVERPGVTIEECRGNIDVGGPSALRAAAKNYLRVMTVPSYSPEAYDALIAQINANCGCTDFSMRRRAFAETFKVLSAYDAKIAEFANDLTWDDTVEMYEIVK